jgi:hypothetical protein
MVVHKAEFVGQKFGAVENQLRVICGNNRYSLLIMEPDSLANIDVEQNRMCVYIDAGFVVTDIRIG